MKVIYDLVVDFARPNKSNTIIISEGDKNSRLLHFTLLANKQPMDMIDVSVATVKGIKADGSVIYGDALIVKDDEGNNLNELEYVIPANFTDLANKVTMTITLMANDGSTISSFEYYVEVRNALYSEDDYISQEDLNGFRDLLNRCMAALEKMETMVEKDALPCPYPLNLTIEDEEFNYNGANQIDIELKGMAYIEELGDIDTDDIDESAAGIATQAAVQARQYSEISEISATSAMNYKDEAEEAADASESHAETARNSSGMAQAYANQARESATQFAGEIDKIKQAIRDLGGDI